MKAFQLQDERVLLSVPTAGDIDRITELCQDPSIRDWTTVPSPYIRAHASTFVNALARDGWALGTSLTWAVRTPTDETVLGMVGVSLSGDGKAEIGYWLAPEARGRGLMTHAVRLVAERLFADGELGVTHLIWWAYVGNWASRRVAWATGFRHHGTVRGGQPQRGHRRDAWIATLRPGEPMRPATRWPETTILHGDRITLRPPEPADADAITEACGDPESQWWLSSLPRPYTTQDAHEFIDGATEQAASGHGLRWAITRAGGGVAIGSITVSFAGTPPTQGTIGYLVHPAARGTGAATEALQLITRHAVIPAEDGGLGLRRLVIEHADGNDASRTVIERAGFHHTGTDRSAARLDDGSYVDHHRYDLLAHEINAEPWSHQVT